MALKKSQNVNNKLWRWIITCYDKIKFNFLQFSTLLSRVKGKFLCLCIVKSYLTIDQIKLF